jgi:hypothetical protein
MPSTSTRLILETMAASIRDTGLHTGEQFASAVTGRLDIAAHGFRAVTGKTPGCFYTDEGLALLLIETCAPLMDALKAISAALDTEPCHIDEAPQYVDHVANWARTPGIGEKQPPTTSEVIGRILRAIQTLDAGLDYVPHQRAA